MYNNFWCLMVAVSYTRQCYRQRWRWWFGRTSFHPGTCHHNGCTSRL